MSNVSTNGLARLAATSALIAAATALCPPRAQAQTPPAGAILDVAASRGGVLGGYESFTTSFVATGTSTTVSFAFRNQPGYFSFDDASVTAAGGTTNLLANAGFEAATVGASVPAGWGSFSQPLAATATGGVASAASPGGCGPNGAHGGTNFWCAGSVEGYAGLYQTIPTTAGQTYNVGFWLADTSGVPLNNPAPGAFEFAVDALVYAQSGLPGGTVSTGAGPVGTVPEPASVALLGTGLLGLVAATLRRRKAA